MISRASVLEARIAPGHTPKPRFLDGIAKQAVLHRLAGLRDGILLLHEGKETYGFGQSRQHCELQINVYVHDPRFYSDIAFAGSIGAGESYMAGYWSTDDLTGLVRLLLVNRHVLDDMEGGLARLTRPLQKMLHWLNRNTQTGSRRNIAAHYDLGNELFRLMLDERMMYSSAIFARDDMSLDEAQQYRLDLICQKLDLQAEDHLLEIGTGWGGLAIHAAQHYGCRVTTTTISQEQYALAKARVDNAGLTDRITLLLDDYRNLEGTYDKLVSIEMIEAIGHQYYPQYFQQCSRLLKPGGLMLLQAITIADQQYEAARNSVDFIQRYIFPGSCIPSVTAMLTAATRYTDLRLFDLQDIGPHYATTLRAWRDNIFRQAEAVRQAGYSQEFMRMWEFYLCYCEGGFIERAISDVHMLLAKPGNRRVPLG